MMSRPWRTFGVPPHLKNGLCPLRHQRHSFQLSSFFFSRSVLKMEPNIRFYKAATRCNQSVSPSPYVCARPVKLVKSNYSFKRFKVYICAQSTTVSAYKEEPPTYSYLYSGYNGVQNNIKDKKLMTSLSAMAVSTASQCRSYSFADADTPSFRRGAFSGILT